MDTLWFILIGLAAGFISGRTVSDRGFDLAGDMTVGAFCALMGGKFLQSADVLTRGTVMDGLLVTGAVLSVLLLMSLLARSSLSYKELQTYA
ncbi:MAG TPA: GlsB/YeaQ/YmgE family stress response membrane protein [Candidatus Peribacteria bacterium]|nr:GlsB/YeaQ/YmgE family stress response membrane protein [Candidatus Peribacteria bacterium]